MNGCTIVLEEVVYSDTDKITPVTLDDGTWNLTVDSESRTKVAIEVDCGVSNEELVCAVTLRIVVLVVIGLDIFAITPRASVAGRIASSFFKCWEGLGNVGCWTARDRCSAVEWISSEATTITVATEGTVVTSNTVSRSGSVTVVGA